MVCSHQCSEVKKKKSRRENAVLALNVVQKLCFFLPTSNNPKNETAKEKRSEKTTIERERKENTIKPHDPNQLRRMRKRKRY